MSRLISETAETLPSGRVYQCRVYEGGFTVHSFGDPEPVPQPVGPPRTELMSTSHMERLECDTTDEHERAYLVGQWDHVWSSVQG